MNLAQTPDAPLNIEKRTPAVVSVSLDRALPLHRLGEARRREDISPGNVARRLGVTVEDVKRQECKTTDLPLSVLHKWAKALGLPVAELVEEPDDSLSTPLWNRAGLVRVMKTAMSILERARDPRTKRLAQTMVDQLLEIMPELRGVSAWHAVGKPRRRNELGIAAERRLSDKVFVDVVDCEGLR
jgi:transcriptional regulator with XRE-family HTH domain